MLHSETNDRTEKTWTPKEKFQGLPQRTLEKFKFPVQSLNTLALNRKKWGKLLFHGPKLFKLHSLET